jgi:two-component sensor histidine kinase
LELAIRETTHRFKNNLQMILSLLELHSSEDNERHPLQQLSQLRLHIQALGQIHDILIEDTRRDPLIGDISVRAALRKLVPLLQRTLGAKHIEFTSDEVRLPIKQGMSLALLVNELVSNAVKHGGKQVSLRLAVVGEEVTLEVTDDGPGFAADFDPTTGNTGMELVERLSRLDLDGHVTVTNRRQGGGRVQVTFPAPMLKQA